GTGYIFLGLMITYMPLLHQAYGAREVGTLLILSRAGHPPNGIKLLLRYSGPGHSEIVRTVLFEAERWLAETLQTHLSHPVLTFYVAQHWGQSWLTCLTSVLDCCAIIIVTREGLLQAQARITYRMGLRLLQDLTAALGIASHPQPQVRLTE